MVENVDWQHHRLGAHPARDHNFQHVNGPQHLSHTIISTSTSSLGPLSFKSDTWDPHNQRPKLHAGRPLVYEAMMTQGTRSIPASPTRSRVHLHEGYTSSLMSGQPPRTILGDVHPAACNRAGIDEDRTLSEGVFNRQYSSTVDLPETYTDQSLVGEQPLRGHEVHAGLGSVVDSEPSTDPAAATFQGTGAESTTQANNHRVWSTEQPAPTQHAATYPPASGSAAFAATSPAFACDGYPSSTLFWPRHPALNPAPTAAAAGAGAGSYSGQCQQSVQPVGSTGAAPWTNSELGAAQSTANLEFDHDQWRYHQARPNVFEESRPGEDTSQPISGSTLSSLGNTLASYNSRASVEASSDAPLQEGGPLPAAVGHQVQLHNISISRPQSQPKQLRARSAAQKASTRARSSRETRDAVRKGHDKKRKGEKRGDLGCDMCTSANHSKESLKRHYDRHHNAYHDAFGPDFPCNLCDAISIQTCPELYQRHRTGQGGAKECKVMDALDYDYAALLRFIIERELAKGDNCRGLQCIAHWQFGGVRGICFKALCEEWVKERAQKGRLWWKLLPYGDRIPEMELFDDGELEAEWAVMRYYEPGDEPRLTDKEREIVRLWQERMREKRTRGR